MRTHPAPLDLEELAFSGEATADTRSHVSACSACEAHVARLRVERAQFLVSHPRVPLRALAPRRAPLRWIPALAAALVVGVVGLSWWVRGEGEVRLRGRSSARLDLFVSAGGAPAVPFDGRTLRRGDALRFGISSPRGGYAFIANVDGSGQVTRYFPTEAPRSAPVPPGEQLLPGTIVLDEFVGPERLVLLLSEGPLDEDAVREALRAAFASARGDLDALRVADLPAETSVIALRKVP